jgi:tRNA modification GTPase
MTADALHQETIAAIATAPGAAGIGVVRASGPLVPLIAQALLRRPPTPRHAHFVAFRHADGQLIDRGLLLYFPAPASYTGEHVLEAQGHGSAVLLDALLRRICELGARLARPGEFTERAFLNGKVDLAQADALLQTLIALRVHIEAAIDFPEEEIDFLADPAIAQQLDALREQWNDLLIETRRGVRLNDGLRVAIVGRPNVGKSSLLNALAGNERAIVTDIAGTTRDVVRESVNLDGVVLELADTAGLRDTHDPVEREGVRRAHGERERADVVLLMTDGQHVETDLAWLKDLPAAVERIIVVNKIDLDNTRAHHEHHEHSKRLRLSVKTGEGLDILREHLKQLAGAGSGEGAFSARRRHVLALEQVGDHLINAAQALNDIRAGELAAEELRQAQHALGEITGTYTSDDLLGAIFGSFCIGK